MDINLKIRQLQKTIFQLNDLVSLLISEIDSEKKGFQKLMNDKFEVLKKKIYSINGTVEKNKYNLN